MMDRTMDDRDEDFSGLTPLTWIERQAGVIPWLPGTDPVQLVLVTSRRTGRWVFPKGAIDPGMTAHEAAEQEALEEAGVVGRVECEVIGSYRSLKIRPPALWTVDVALYPLRIEQVLDDWVEADQRQRRFVTLAEASELIADPDLLGLAMAVERRLMGR